MRTEISHPEESAAFAGKFDGCVGCDEVEIEWEELCLGCDDDEGEELCLGCVEVDAVEYIVGR